MDPIPEGPAAAGGLDELMTRARAIVGKRVSLVGPSTHKGRVGEGVERLLLGRVIGAGPGADHPAAEVKSVPVIGERVVERVKLGVLSDRSHPLGKCGRILFVFCERRGDDVFIVGHALVTIEDARWLELWRAGLLVETAAGISGDETRGLYLTPRFFYERGLWPVV